MACSCGALISNPTVYCNAQVSGIDAISVYDAAASPAAYKALDFNIESSTFNSVLSYDRNTNAAKLTTTVNIDFNSANASIITFVEKMNCAAGHKVKVEFRNGSEFECDGFKPTTFTHNSGDVEGNGVSGVLILESVITVSSTSTNPFTDAV